MKYKKLLSPPPVEAATQDEALNFVRGLQPLRPEDDKPVDEAAVREYVNKFSLGSLQGIARRIMMDIMKGRIDDEDAAAEPGPTKGKTQATKQSPPSGKSATRRQKDQPARAPDKTGRALAAARPRASGSRSGACIRSEHGTTASTHRNCPQGDLRWTKQDSS